MEMGGVAMPHICQPPFVMDKEIHAQNPLTYKKSQCEIVAELGVELCFHLGTGARQGTSSQCGYTYQLALAVEWHIMGLKRCFGSS